MAANTYHFIEQGWDGDQKRHRVIVTLGDTNNQVVPEAVGLHTISSVRPTNRTGTIDGVASVTIATITDLAVGASNTYVLNAAAAKVELNFYGD